MNVRGLERDLDQTRERPDLEKAGEEQGLYPTESRLPLGTCLCWGQAPLFLGRWQRAGGVTRLQGGLPGEQVPLLCRVWTPGLCV